MNTPYREYFETIIPRARMGSESLGSLSNYDDDHNDDFKKTKGLMIKTTALHVHHAF